MVMKKILTPSFIFLRGIRITTFLFLNFFLIEEGHHYMSTHELDAEINCLINFILHVNYYRENKK